VRQGLGGSRAADDLPSAGCPEAGEPAAEGPTPAQLPARCPFCGEVLQWLHQLQPGGRSPPRC
jgi:hypothetical protein